MVLFLGSYGSENHHREGKDGLEEPGLDAAADATTDSLEAVRIIKLYEEIIETQNKRAIGYVGKYGAAAQKVQRSRTIFRKCRTKYILHIFHDRII